MYPGVGAREGGGGLAAPPPPADVPYAIHACQALYFMLTSGEKWILKCLDIFFKIGFVFSRQNP